MTGSVYRDVVEPTILFVSIVLVVASVVLVVGGHELVAVLLLLSVGVCLVGMTLGWLGLEIVRGVRRHSS